MKTKIALVVSLFVALAFASAAAEISVPQELEKSLLAENWVAVADSLRGVDAASPSPVMRLLKGHACLALNRNNEAIRLFLASSESDALEPWKSWTADFATRHAETAVAHYLRGDALARSREWPGAFAAFDRALQLHSAHALTLNARGVCRALGGKWNEALDDFAGAAKASPRLADVWANRGALYVQRSTGAKGALTAFDAALERSPDNALAKMGRACSLFGAGKWSEAEKALEACRDQPEIGDLVSLNLVAIRDTRLDAVERDVASLALNAGVSVKVEVRELAAKVQNLKAINGDIFNHSKQAGEDGSWGRIYSDWGRVANGVAAGATLVGSKFPLVAPIAARWAFASKMAAIGFEKKGADLKESATRHQEMAKTGELRWAKENSSLNPARNNPSIQSKGSSVNPLEKLYSPIKSGPPPGGATLDFSSAHVDSGNWGVFVPFGTLYSGISWVEAKAGEKGSDENPAK